MIRRDFLKGLFAAIPMSVLTKNFPLGITEPLPNVFSGVLLNMDGETDSAGDSFALGCIAHLPKKPIPVMIDFAEENGVGLAEVYQEGDKLMYRIRFADEISRNSVRTKALASAVPAVGGKLVRRAQALVYDSVSLKASETPVPKGPITEFVVTAVGLTFTRNTDHRIESLAAQERRYHGRRDG